MAKKKSESIENKIEIKNDFYSMIKKENGVQLLDDIETKYFIDTGNLALNYINSGKFLGGGIPGGRITQVFGPSASSKSLLSMCCLGAVQRMGGVSVLLDCERSASKNFAFRAGHADPKKVVITEPITIEQVELKITNLTKTIRQHLGKDIPILFVWDSIGVCPTEREYKETDLPEDYNDATWKKIVGRHESPGERARAAGDMLRKINPFLSENNASLFIINQVRAAIGNMYGPSETYSGGGKALEFYCSLIVRSSAHKLILDENKTPIGVNLKFTNKKNRFNKPHLAIENVPLYWDMGIHPVGGLLSVLLKYAKRIDGKLGKFKVLEPWADGKEINFQSSMERNDVPLDVLYQCPKLVDAENEQQVKDYLGIFSEAIELSESGLKEVEMNDEDEIDKILNNLNQEE